MLRAKPCKICGSQWHTPWLCPDKPKGLISKSKPLRREAVKTRQKREATTEEWFRLNPPDANGEWDCYISKHPFCPKKLTVDTIVLEHDISKARDKSRQFDLTNIFPACTFDNAAKGSLSAKEYMQT